MGAGDSFLQGVDVSKYQSSTPSLAGVDFLIARAGIATKPDATFAMHIANAKAAGIVTGSYWFNWGAIAVSDQVDAYIAREQAVGGVDLHVIDWEGPDGFTAAQAAEFIAIYRARTGDRIGLYASEGRFTDLGQDWDWIANYSREPTKHYDLWQNGPFRGADGDLFPGTHSDLRRLIGAPDMEWLNYTAVGEDWHPSDRGAAGNDAPIRLVPDRATAIVVRRPAGSTIRTIGQFTRDGENWRVTRLADGRTGFIIRGDLVPVTAGGDPAVDKPLLDYVQRLDTSAAAVTQALDHVQPAAEAVLTAIKEARPR